MTEQEFYARYGELIEQYWAARANDPSNEITTAARAISYAIKKLQEEYEATRAERE